MAKYLDLSGLEYFWGKIKTHVSTAIADGKFVSYDTQSLTSAQKETARKNIVAGATNPNLLDNAWWGSGEVVNQRGQSSVTLTGNSQYWIDRWTTTQYNGTATVGLGASGITITPSGSSMGYMRQVIPNGTSLDGKVLTASILLSNGTVYSGTITRAAGTTQVFLDSDGIYLALTNADMWYVRIGRIARTIRAVKLELGTVSTLANDAPPNYAEELAKCQSRFFRLKLEGNKCYGIGFAESTTSVRLMIPVPSPMRTSPTITVSGTPRLKGNGQVLVPSAYATNNVTNFNASVCVTVTTTGATQYAIYALSTNDSSTYIDFSADL